jgi:hypothetical protein
MKQARTRMWSASLGGSPEPSACSQVLERTSVVITRDTVEARFTVSLPAAGRSVLGHKAAQLLTEALPHVIKNSLGTCAC